MTNLDQQFLYSVTHSGTPTLHTRVLPHVFCELEFMFEFLSTDFTENLFFLFLLLDAGVTSLDVTRDAVTRRETHFTNWTRKWFLSGVYNHVCY